MGSAAFRAWFHLSADPRVRRLTRGWILPSLWDWPQSIQHTCDLAKPRAPAGAPEYKPGVSPRTPGKPCIAGQALNGRQTSGATAQCRRFAIVLVPAGSRDLLGPELARGAAKELQTVSVLNELRRSRGKGSPETSLVGAVGTGCQPVPGHILHLGICVKPGSRLAAGTYWARDLQRGAAEKSLKVSILNELRRSRGKGSPASSSPYFSGLRNVCLPQQDKVPFIS